MLPGPCDEVATTPQDGPQLVLIAFLRQPDFLGIVIFIDALQVHFVFPQEASTLV